MSKKGQKFKNSANNKARKVLDPVSDVSVDSDGHQGIRTDLEISNNNNDDVNAIDPIDQTSNQKIESQDVEEPEQSQDSQAPVYIEKLSKSIFEPIPLSNDVEFLTHEENMIGTQISTLDTILVRDPNNRNPNGPWVHECKGRNPETHKLIIEKIPAKVVKVEPSQIVRYRGNVAADLNSVHTANFSLRGKRECYVFDRFFSYKGKRLERCCLVMDRIAQAGLLYEKKVSKKTFKGIARLKQIRANGVETGKAMYEVIGAEEPDYRDLKRLFERHYMRKTEDDIADDIGLKSLIGGQS